MATHSGPDGRPPALKRIADISPGWIEDVLRASGLGSVAVSAVELEPIGAGNASDTKRVLIDYAEHALGAPTSLVCKFHPDDDQRRMGMEAGGTFDREIGSFRAIAARDACRIPLAYLLAHDGGNFNLVMEDLSSRAVLGDQIAGCAPDEAAAVLVEMGRLHRAFAGSTEADASDWMMRMSTLADHFGAEILRGAEVAEDRFGDRLSGAAYTMIRECAELADAWFRVPSSRLTLTHGDLRVDNVLFERPAGRAEAILIDWQLTGLRNPMWDVAYFLASSLKIEDRRRHERKLLVRYLETLGDAIPGFDEAQAIADCRLYMIASLAINILSTAVLPRDPSVDALILTLLERARAAADDWDALQAVRGVIG